MRIVVVRNSKIVVAHFVSQQDDVMSLYADCEIGRYSGLAKPGSEIDITKYEKLRDPIVLGAAS